MSSDNKDPPKQGGVNKTHVHDIGHHYNHHQIRTTMPEDYCDDDSSSTPPPHQSKPSKRSKQTKPTKPSKQKQPKEKDDCKQFVHDRDWIIQQACFILGILNLVGDIVIKRPRKTKIKSMTFFTIESITITNETYLVDDLAENRINEIFGPITIEKTTTSNKRRFHFKIVEYIHVLLQIIEKTRFSVTTIDRKYNVTSKKKMLTGANVDNIIYDKKDIITIGSKVHEIIQSEFFRTNKPASFTIHRGNTEIMAALLAD